MPSAAKRSRAVPRVGGQEELRAAELPLGEEREAAAARAARLQRWEHEEMSVRL